MILLLSNFDVFFNTKNVEKLVDITDLNLLLRLEMLVNIQHQVAINILVW